MNEAGKNAFTSTTEALSLSSFFNSRVFGFALTRAWVYIMFLGLASSTLTLTGDPIPPVVYAYSSYSLIAMLLVCAAGYKLFESYICHPVFRWIGPAINALGTIFATTLVVLDVPPLVLGILGGMLTGIGSALVDLGWGDVYRNRSRQDAGLEIPMASFIAALIYAFVSQIPPEAGIALTSLLPLGSGYLMLVSQHAWEKKDEESEKPLDINVGIFTARIGLCALAISTADGIMRTAIMSFSGISSEAFYHPAQLLSGVATAILLIGFQVYNRGKSFRTLYKVIAFIITVSIALAPAAISLEPIGSTLTLIGYNTFNIFIWILLADIACTYRFSAAAVFGIGWGMLTVGSVVGQNLGAWIVETMHITWPSLSLIVGIAIITVVGVSFFVLKDDDLIDISKLIQNPEDMEQIQIRKTPSLAEICSNLSEEYGLTPREAEIFELFARGRNRTRIQEELCLSQGTVTTHLRHIYQKMEVHSKQELLDLVDSKKQVN